MTRRTEIYTDFDVRVRRGGEPYRLRSRRISFAASAPDRPVIPVPGWVDACRNAFAGDSRAVAVCGRTVSPRYDRLYAHSVEAYKDNELVGGLYGVTLGGAFMGESMFSWIRDASKVCLVTLVEHLKARGYVLHDTQFTTPHLLTLGVTEIPRKVYEQRLRDALQLPCTWNDSSAKY